MTDIFQSILKTVLVDLPYTLDVGHARGMRLDLSEWSKRFSWKGGPWSLEAVWPSAARGAHAQVDGNILFLPLETSMKEFLKVRSALLRVRELLYLENPESTHLWGRTTSVAPHGFKESENRESGELLNELYGEAFVVQEKKQFVMDLRRSQGMYMVSIDENSPAMVDAASQIASLTLGFNTPELMPLLHRPELLDLGLDLEKWDVYQAFTRFLKKKSGFKHVYLAQSGSEAVEIALQACQVRYPERRRMIAFDGSFHGRTLLPLHLTSNESKRKPFEIYPGIVEFVPFPETKTPSESVIEPNEWVRLWSNPESGAFEAEIQTLMQTSDALLKDEVNALLHLKRLLRDEKFLAVVIEPILCEGGDRYGSKRFYRALRLLTRAYQTPLILDEVQAGFGLGGPFFWNEHFNWVQGDGKTPDRPDAVCLAKKAQAAFCLTDTELDLLPEGSSASLMRGYLQAMAIEDADASVWEKKVTNALAKLQRGIGAETLLSPRGQGYAFAFDVPTADILNQMIAYRFEAGILFYPAGDRTARFRLMTTTTEEEFADIFFGVYRCFEHLASKGVIAKVVPLEVWVRSEFPEWEALLKRTPGVQVNAPWSADRLPERSLRGLKSYRTEDWTTLFKTLVRVVPEILRVPSNREFPVSRLESLTPDELWSRYESDPQTTWLEVLWQGSRAFGLKLRVISSEEAETLTESIQKLEANLYEPIRQADPKTFVAEAKAYASAFLAFFDEERSLKAVSLTCPIENHREVPMISTDPLFGKREALYSYDVSVHPSVQGRGIGFRLKVEQILEGMRSGHRALRSRNRWPEAQRMSNLNRSFGSVTLEENPRDYGGSGLSHYQSVPLEIASGHRPYVGSPWSPILKHKTALASFLSPLYVHHMRALRALLPEHLRHVYLASGRAESVEKMLKLLYTARPQAKLALSFRGDQFGKTTAGARSLGGESGLRYFDWPILSRKWEDFELEMQSIDPASVLGVFMDPMKAGAVLPRLMEKFKALSIPVIFTEEFASGYRFSDRHFFASAALKEGPQGMVWYGGGQVAVCAVHETLFLKKPLQMISTWDGDELSLALLLEEAWKAKVKHEEARG